MIGVASNFIPALLTLSVAGGAAGTIPCADATYGASAGEAGKVTTGITLPESRIPFQPSTASIDLPFIIADPGDTLTIPLKLASHNLAFAGATKYTVVLRFNKHLLLPIGSTPKGVASNDDRVVTLSGPLSDTTTIVADLKFIVLLGPTDTTPLTIESVVWGNQVCPIDQVLKNGSLSVNTCRTGDARLVDAGPEALLRPVHPNPASASIDIAYQLIEHGPTRISVFDTRGAEVALLLDIQQAPGAYSLHFDATPLPDGTYLCVLQTPTQRFARTFLIQR